MYHDLLLAFFLLFLLLGGIYFLRMFFRNESSSNPEVGLKRIGETQPNPAVDLNNTVLFYEPKRETNFRRPKVTSQILSIFLLMGCGYVLFTHREAFCGCFANLSTNSGRLEAKASISALTVDGHQIVDGVNWFMIVATSTEGIPFEGWVSENAIVAQPPKENKMADEMMQKLGLPTNRERMESVKQLKKVGAALNNALKDVRPKNN